MAVLLDIHPVPGGRTLQPAGRVTLCCSLLSFHCFRCLCQPAKARASPGTVQHGRVPRSAHPTAGLWHAQTIKAHILSDAHVLLFLLMSMDKDALFIEEETEAHWYLSNLPTAPGFTGRSQIQTSASEWTEISLQFLHLTVPVAFPAPELAD